MIGNDIVDLNDPEAQPTERTPGFDARVFSPAENDRIQASDDRVRARWLTWAAKEAGYKLLRQRAPTVRFVPRQYAVGFDSPEQALAEGREQSMGWVEAEGLRLVCEWASAPGFVHAFCRLGGGFGGGLGETLPRPCVGFDRLEVATCVPERLSEGVRVLALRKIGLFLGVGTRRLAIHKRGRIPGLWLDGAPLASALSLSHHGKMVAFAFSASSRVLSTHVGSGGAATVMAAGGDTL
ncbi:MAG: 4'-phosphopantetheinyl transferase superfamily protein [Myxococcota bacterium]|nr:4'-phosphopantetheinyl transferase superfamily protein [Myxococcota bacterium]